MSTATTRRRALLGLAVLLALGVLAWLLVDDSAHSRALSRAEPGAADTSHVLHAASGASAEDALAGPQLTGSKDARGPIDPSAVTVRVRGPRSNVLVGVRLQVVAAADAMQAGCAVLAEAVTDARGMAVFGDQPLDGSRVVRALRESGAVILHPFPDGNGSFDVVSPAGSLAPSGSTPLDRPTVTLTLATGLRLALDVVAPESSEPAPLPARVKALFPALRAFADGGWDPREDALCQLAVAPGQPYDVHYAIRTEGRHAVQASMRGWILPHVEYVFMTVPAHQDARIHVLLDDGLPAVAGDDVAVHWTWRGRQNEPGDVARVTLDAAGRLHVGGVPHRVGEVVRLAGRVGQQPFHAEGILPEDPRQTLELHPVFVEGAEARAAALQVLAPSPGLVMFDLVGLEVDVGAFTLDRILLIHGGSGRAGPAAAAAAEPGVPFEVHVKHFASDGMAGAVVKLGGQLRRTDEEGVAGFRGLKAGTHVGHVFGHGAVQRIEALVPSAGVGRLEVGGDPGGAIDLVVEDAAGTPLPYAQVLVKQASGIPWADHAFQASNASILRTIGQRIDPFVGPDGRRLLRYIEVGTTRLEVRYGTRTTTVEVEVVRGTTHEVRAVLPVLTLEAPKPEPEAAQEAGGR